MNKRESGEQLLKYHAKEGIETQTLFCYIYQQVHSDFKEVKLEAITLQLTVIKGV